MRKSGILKRTAACLTAAATILTGTSLGSVNAAVIDPENPNNYDNFAEALQLALCSMMQINAEIK